MLSFRRRDKPHALFAGMTGVKLGDRVVQIGCAHGGRLAAIAAQVGLSGQAVVVVDNETDAARARKGGSQAGVLIEVELAPSTKLPLDDGAFDLALIDDTGGLFANMGADDRSATVREVHRVLRPGGRVMVIGIGAPEGLAALFSRSSGTPPFDAEPFFRTDGFRAARTLAEREGMRFVEALKPRT